MKKIHLKGIFTLLVALSFVCLSAFHAFATEEGYSWYCVRNKDHLQPTADARFSFINGHNCFYIDKEHGDASEDKVVYLTFDAGYENGNVEKILDTLEREDVKGAFFVLGNLIDKNSDLVLRMFEEGHLVCNHTYSHGKMVGRSKEEFAAELKRLEAKCKEKTGHSLSAFYRPPEGRFDEESLRFADELGYCTVFWSFAYADWDNAKQMSPSAAKKKILDNVHNGEIMLLHPTSATNAEVLGEIISILKAQGYRFGTLDELIKNPGGEQ